MIPIFEAVKASAAVTALIGGNPVRFYLFGQAPQNPELPYAVWRLIFGAPENYLGQLPDMDSASIQVDVYSSALQGCDVARNVKKALMDAIEPHAYVTADNGESRDPDTENYHVGFDCDWFVSR